jgi:hypothetical protein
MQRARKGEPHKASAAYDDIEPFRRSCIHGKAFRFTARGLDIAS